MSRRPERAACHTESVFADGLSAARRSVLGLFFLHGVVFSTWVSRIPAVQDNLHLSPAVLGLALLGVALGSVPSMPVTGYLIGRYGSRPVAAWSTLAFCASLPLMALAPDAWLLGLALMLYGAAAGAMDVSMNAHGIIVEANAGRPMMSTFHAMFSVGGIAGSAAGGFIARQAITPLVHFSAAAAIFIATSLLVIPGMLPARTDAVPHAPAFGRITRPVLVLGVLAFCFLLSEGVMADWTAVYLRSSVGTDAGLAALGYAFFSAAMTVGRFTGDWLTARLGRARLVRAGSLLAVAGLCFALILHTVPATFTGFAAVGAGYSVIVPLIFAAAGRSGNGSAGKGLAAVNTMGYLGFLAGPPLIGFVAEAFTLRAALGLLVLFSFAGVVLAKNVDVK